MGFLQQLSDNAALLSALIALLALVISLIGLMQSRSASKDSKTARDKASDAQWKMSEHLEAIAGSLRIPERSSGSPVPMTGLLTGRLVERSGIGMLVVANIGPQTVRVEGIAADQPYILRRDQIEILIGSELLPGEHCTIPANLGFGTSLPARVTFKWIGPDGELRERIQALSISETF
ncbi:hypothetical protein [Glycomyces tritici]|uniref:Uncharacterized protein n=1 Tax=Glycomyces tritici TaxID=2665176 RepID=A0ABT7YX49_9ACTN|nr:hypothetical protein [Glycomyces tritici]MDN3243188.1 hypothetical protein [Glycomyces tritici]